MLRHLNIFILTCILSFVAGNTNRVLALCKTDPQTLHSASSPRSKLIAIEGMPGAGKTSVLASFAEELEGTCILLPELNLEPDSPWKKLSSKEQGDIFHKLWVERMMLLNTFKDSKLCFLLDRTYFSNLAFVYALDSIKGTHNYQAQKKAFNESFANNKFDLIFVFDISPEIGLQRRLLRGDRISWPWSNVAFLKAMRQFYREELPKYAQGKIKYINTDKDTNLIKAEVRAELLSLVDNNNKNSLVNEGNVERQAEIILNFAKTNKLGEPTTRVINVVGIPTVYFLKQGIQLEQHQPVFFNNNQLNKVSYKHNLSIRH